MSPLEISIKNLSISCVQKFLGPNLSHLESSEEVVKKVSPWVLILKRFFFRLILKPALFDTALPEYIIYINNKIIVYIDISIYGSLFALILYFPNRIFEHSPLNRQTVRIESLNFINR